MKNNQLIQTLQELGLSENEADVYFTALSLGPTTILKLAQLSELKRTTVYSVVESLKLKGLITTQVQGFKKKFVAEDPRKLESMLDARRKRFHALIPEFSALYNLQGGESFIKYYEGLEAVKGVYENLIRDIKPGEDYRVMGNQDQWIVLDEEYFDDFLYRRAKLPINIRMIFQNTARAYEWKKIERNLNSQIRILAKDIALTTNLVVTPQRVLIHQLKHPIIGIVIENKSIIQMHSEMHDVIWKSLSE